MYSINFNFLRYSKYYQIENKVKNINKKYEFIIIKKIIQVQDKTFINFIESKICNFLFKNDKIHLAPKIF